MKTNTLLILLSFLFIGCNTDIKSVDELIIGTWSFQNRTDSHGEQVGPNQDIEFTFDQSEFRGLDEGKLLIGTWNLNDSLLTIHAGKKGTDQLNTEVYRIKEIDDHRLVFTEIDSQSNESYNFSKLK